jgi:t-SNARE complex subunit (syntaxin)
MREFFGDVDIVKKNIMKIKEATKRIEDIKQQVVLTTTSEREKEITKDLEPLIAETNKKASLAKQLLQRIREDTEKMQGKDASVIRIRENLSNTLTRKFVDVMKEYQNTQQNFKTEIKKKVKRQVQIVKPDATSEEIDAVLQSGGGSGEVFKNAILKGDASDSIRNAFLGVQDKYQDVLTLEKSVQELHQMFLDFALLTEQQGDLVDQVEFQVKAASDYIDDGNTNMVSAIEYAKSIRRKQCCLCCIVLTVVGVIVAVIVLKVNGSF